MRRLLLLLPLMLVGCDGDVAGPPTTSIEISKRSGALSVDGISTGATQLSGMSVTGMPSYTTFAYVESVGDSFMLVPATGLSAVPNVLVDAPDGRQWTRQGIPNQIFLAAPFFAIDPVNGDDENACWGASMAAADAVPCKTLAEVNRRLIGSDISTTVVFHLLADVPPTDSTVMTNVKSEHGTGYPLFVGKKTQVGGDYTVSAYATHDPASNTGFLLSATGLGASGNVGHIISNATEDKWAFIQSAPTADQVRLTQPNTWDAIAFSGAFTASFTVGETVRVWTLPVLQQFPWTSDVQYPSVDQVEIRGVFTTPADPTQAIFGSASPIISHSIINGVLWQGSSQAGLYGVLFSGSYSNLASAQSLFINASGILGIRVVLSSGVPLFQDGFDIEDGNLLLDSNTRAFVYDPTAYISIFDCVRDSAIVADTGSSFSVYDSNTPIYGTGNTGFIYTASAGSQSALGKTGATVVTSAAHPIWLAGTSYDFAQIPITNTTEFATIRD
jgi:hypothetical protein